MRMFMTGHVRCKLVASACIRVDPGSLGWPTFGCRASPELLSTVHGVPPLHAGNQRIHSSFFKSTLCKPVVI